MSFGKSARALSAAYRQFGWIDGSLYVIHRLLTRATGGRAQLHRYYFMAQPVASKPWLPGKRGGSIEVREVKPSDPLLRSLPRPPQAIPLRFSQGAVCLAAVIQDACVGFLWMQLGPYQEDEVRCRYVPLPEGEASWDFDVYVEPEHRNGLVFLRLWDEANRYLAARGVRWSLSRISAFNRGSMTAHTRMGSHCLGSAVFLSLGSLQISMATVSPRFAVTRRETAVPIFALNAAREVESS